MQQDLLKYLAEYTLTGIKAGETRTTFTNIWMVSVGERIFARSWNKSPKSWFTELLKTGRGQIQYGNQILDIRGKKVGADDPIQKEINKAYTAKYTQPENKPYVEGIIKEEYLDYTMEFLLQ